MQYLKDVATKYDLEKYIKFDSKVESATWDEERGVWEVDIVSNDGKHFKDTCEILVNASGILRKVLKSLWDRGIFADGLQALRCIPTFLVSTGFEAN